MMCWSDACIATLLRHRQIRHSCSGVPQSHSAQFAQMQSAHAREVNVVLLEFLNAVFISVVI